MSKHDLTGAYDNSSESHEGKSRLIELPPEIRQMILRYVLGDHLIHIECNRKGSNPPSQEASIMHQPRQKFHHAVCIENKFEDAIYEESKNGCSEDLHGKSRTTPSDRPARRHHQCTKWLEASHSRSVSPNESKPPHQVDLSLLQVNLKIHDEAAHILFTTCAFSFSNASTFLQFVGSLDPVQQLSSISESYGASPDVEESGRGPKLCRNTSLLN